MDLERLDEALAARSWLTEIGEAPNIQTAGDIRTDAATAYRDLANGERVEPDYEAAAKKLWWWSSNDEWEDIEAAVFVDDVWRQKARSIVDAAIGGKLLVDYPKEADDE